MDAEEIKNEIHREVAGMLPHADQETINRHTEILDEIAKKYRRDLSKAVAEKEMMMTRKYLKEKLRRKARSNKKKQQAAKELTYNTKTYFFLLFDFKDELVGIEELSMNELRMLIESHKFGLTIKGYIRLKKRPFDPLDPINLLDHITLVKPAWR